MTKKEEVGYARALAIEIEGAFGACETVYGYSRESLTASILNVLGTVLGHVCPGKKDLYIMTTHTILGSAVGRGADSLADVDVIKAMTKFMDANAKDLATERLIKIAGEDGIDYLTKAAEAIGGLSIQSLEDLEKHAAELAAYVKENNPELYKKLTPTADNND